MTNKNKRKQKKAQQQAAAAVATQIINIEEGQEWPQTIAIADNSDAAIADAQVKGVPTGDEIQLSEAALRLLKALNRGPQNENAAAQEGTENLQSQEEKIRNGGEENQLIDRLSSAITDPLEMSDDEFLELSARYMREFQDRYRTPVQKFVPGQPFNRDHMNAAFQERRRKKIEYEMAVKQDEILQKKAKEFEQAVQADQESKAKEKAREKANKKKLRVKKLKELKAKEAMEAVSRPPQEEQLVEPAQIQVMAPKQQPTDKNVASSQDVMMVAAAVEKPTAQDISKPQKHVQPEFMGFPLAGGPDDDVSRLLSRDLFQQHLEKARSNAIGLGPGLSDSGDAREGFVDFFDSELFNPFLNKTTRENEENSTIPLASGSGSSHLMEMAEERDGLFISDNEPLFTRLRESEQNRKIKMKEAASTKQVQSEKELNQNYHEGFFSSSLLNPFKSQHGPTFNDEFLMKDFENLLKSKPQDVHKRMKLSTDAAPPIAHLNLLYDRFEDLEDSASLIDQVYYTDSEAAIGDYHSEVTRGRQNWLQEAYRDFLPMLEHRSYRATPLINNLFATDTKQQPDEIAAESNRGITSSSTATIEDNAMPQGPKLYLLKLIEYNKIALLEKYGCAGATALTQSEMYEDEQQLAEVQSCMTRLMRQTLIRDELRHVLEDYDFEGSLAEQKAAVFAMVKMSKKLVNALYKKSFAFTLVKSKNQPHQTQNFPTIINFSSGSKSGNSAQKITEVLWKDTISESRAYIQFLQKVSEVYEHILDKAQFFRKFIAAIFFKVPLFRFLNLDALFKGFFFLFVYKDFVVREVIQRVQDQLHQANQRHVLAKVEQDYQIFMEADLTPWVSIMLECKIFESYQSIVAPNESVQTNRMDKTELNKNGRAKFNLKTSVRSPQSFLLSKPLNMPQPIRSSYSSLKGETANFIALQKRYMKAFLVAYYRYSEQISLIQGVTSEQSKQGHQTWSIRNTAMYLVDSDFDTEDEAFGDDIEEVISSSHAASDHVDCNEDQSYPSPEQLEENFFSRQTLQAAQNINLDGQQQKQGGAKKLRRKPRKKKDQKEDTWDQIGEQQQQSLREDDEQLAESAAQLVLEDELCEEEDEDEDDELEDDFFDHSQPQYEFFKDLTRMKPFGGTSKFRQQRVVTIANGDKLMHEEMANFVNQLANLGQQQRNHAFDKKQSPQQPQQPASFISERRNKKRKELVQTILGGPFAAAASALSSHSSSATLHQSSNAFASVAAANAAAINPSGINAAAAISADTDEALRNMSSLFGSFRLPEQLQNFPKATPWKPSHKNSATTGVQTEKDAQAKMTEPKKADDILDVSADEADAAEVKEAKPTGTEEQKKKKNRRKKRTRKQKHQLLQKQILEKHGKCSCECHSDLAAALARQDDASTGTAPESADGGGKDGGAAKETTGSAADNRLISGTSKVVGWSGCSLQRGCQADGDCAQEDGKPVSNLDAAARIETSESDVEFEAELRNFELRLGQQHLQCMTAPLAKPNSSSHLTKPPANVSASSGNGGGKNFTTAHANLIQQKKSGKGSSKKEQTVMVPEPCAVNYKPDSSILPINDPISNQNQVALVLWRPKLRPNLSKTWLERVRTQEKQAYVRT